jgi:hypothetical protein
MLDLAFLLVKLPVPVSRFTSCSRPTKCLFFRYLISFHGFYLRQLDPNLCLFGAKCNANSRQTDPKTMLFSGICCKITLLPSVRQARLVTFFSAMRGGRNVEDFAALGDGAPGARDSSFGHRPGQGIVREGGGLHGGELGNGSMEESRRLIQY